MKFRYVTIVASAVLTLGFAAAAHACGKVGHGCACGSHYAYPATWKSGGWLQLHNQPGHKEIGSIGTQRFHVPEKGVYAIYPYGFYGHYWLGGPYIVDYYGVAGYYGLPGTGMCGCQHHHAMKEPCAGTDGACKSGHHMHKQEKEESKK